MPFDDPLPELRPIAGFEGLYSVTSNGCVRSHEKRKGRGVHAARWLRAGINSGGYYTVVLIHAKVSSCRTVHSLVAEAWIGPRPVKHDINHIDGVKTNNARANLEYCTRSDNVLHAFATGLARPHPGCRSLTTEQATEVRRLARSGVQQTQIARKFGLSKASIGAIVHNRTYTSKVDVSEPLTVDGRYMGENLTRRECPFCEGYGFTVCVADIPKEIQQ